MAAAAATGLSAVAREVVHRVERAATSDTGERLVLRRWRQLREVVPLPCRSMHARLRAHALRELVLVEACRTSKFRNESSGQTYRPLEREVAS